MAINMAGRQFTKEDLQRTAGDTAAAIRNMIQQGGNLKIQLESWPDADLLELGLDQNEINAIKGFFIGDLPPIQADLLTSVWLKQLLGLGI